MIQTITENVEEKLYSAIKTGDESLNRSVLQCRFSALGIEPPGSSALVLDLKKVMTDRKATILYCHDGDLFLTWDGTASTVIKAIEMAIKTYCKQKNCEVWPDDFLQYYDMNVHSEALLIECEKKIVELPFEPETEAAKQITKKAVAEFTKVQKESLARALIYRLRSPNINILIVEDQSFSRRLLLSVLDKNYTCHVASDGEEAIAKYATIAPNIVLLDVELPDINGHNLAALFKKYDPDSYIVMVTANNYVRDVDIAKNNKVQGFIAKPYNKQKILESVSNYKEYIKKRGIKCRFQ